MTHATTIYYVQFNSMNGNISNVNAYSTREDALKIINAICELFNIDNWNGQEGGGVGYDIRIELEVE